MEQPFTCGGTPGKQYHMAYGVKPNTIVEFDFRSAGVEPEINAIGMDLNLVNETPNYYELYGTQSMSITKYKDYTGSDWKHYSIQLGEYPSFRGAMSYFYLINDADNPSVADGTSVYFRNIRVRNY